MTAEPSAPSVLMLATFGMEMVECGGRGRDRCRGDAAPGGDRTVARRLGIDDVRFLNWGYGDLHVDRASKREIMRLVREVQPGTVICQDPEHAAHAAPMGEEFRAGLPISPS